MRLKQQVPHNNLPASPRSNHEDMFGSNNNNNNNNNNNREGSSFDPSQFRVLLNQRLVEMTKEKGNGTGVNSATSGGATLPGSYSFYSNSSSPISGLDLSISSSCHGSLGLRLKREPQDIDPEVESNVSSDYESDNSSKDLGYSSLRISRQGPTIIPVPQPQSRTPGLPSSRREAELVNAMMGTTGSRASSGVSGGVGAVGTQGGSSSSRRKPAAPQWVNPGWDTADDEDEEEDDVAMEEDDDDDDKSEDEFRNDLDREMEDDDEDGVDGLRSVRLREKDEGTIINGVCVRQTSDFRSIRPHEDEDDDQDNLMRIDPSTVATEPDLRLRPSSVTSSRASSPPSSTSASPLPSNTPSPMDNRFTARSPSNIAHKDIYLGSSNGSSHGGGGVVGGVGGRGRLSSIERLERALHEPNETWEDEGRQNNIDKLEQRLLKDEAEDWEF